MADTADRIDREGHELRSFDKHGDRLNEVEYHPLVREQEQIVYEEFGLTHDAFHAPPGREEPLGLNPRPDDAGAAVVRRRGPSTVPVSMTTGAAVVLDKFDDGSLKEYFEALTARDLEDPAESVETAFRELQTALATLATEDGDYAQHYAKRLTDLIFDVVSGTLLLSEAQDRLDAGEGREALVARRFVETRFADEAAYGVASGDRFAMEKDAFAAVAHYASVEPDALVERAPADD